MKTKVQRSSKLTSDRLPSSETLVAYAGGRYGGQDSTAGGGVGGGRVGAAGRATPEQRWPAAALGVGARTS